MIWYMQSLQGIWTYDTEENDITKAFNLLSDRLSVKETLNIWNHQRR